MNGINVNNRVILKYILWFTVQHDSIFLFTVTTHLTIKPLSIEREREKFISQSRINLKKKNKENYKKRKSVELNARINKIRLTKEF